jgi:acetyltransferase, cysE/lacA/lpxA/nodL family
MDKPYVNHLGRKHQVVRLLWSIVWSVGARWLPRSVGSGWKRFLLRCFGAKIASTAVVYSSVKVYYPAHLEMDEYACLASDVDCYNVALVRVGKYATVSQGAFLCTASHDIYSPNHELITAPISIGNQAWIGAKAYVGMGVEIGDGTVVGATASVYKSIDAWEIVGGNPAKFIKKRVLRHA